MKVNSNDFTLPIVNWEEGWSIVQTVAVNNLAYIDMLILFYCMLMRL